MIRLLVVLLLALPVQAYTYNRALSVTTNATLLPATLTNFPVLVYISDASLKTASAAPGVGHIQNTTTQASPAPQVTMPADLIFTSDSGGTTMIPWEVESYDGTNGVLRAWVKCASCSTSPAITLYVFYGDATVTTPQNTSSFVPANVWDANFLRVYHTTDGTTLDVTDSTNHVNGTKVNTPTATTGQIDGGMALASASSQSITAGSTGLTANAALTACAWVYGTSYSGGATYQTVFMQLNGGAFKEFYVKSNGKLAVYFDTGNYDGSGVATLSNTTWYRVCLTYDGTSFGNAYVNGVLDHAFASGALSNNIGTISIGNDYNTAGRFWNGRMDEIRFSDSARSVNWLLAEYNNQSDPATFVAVGAEIGGSVWYRLVAQ